MSQSLKAIYEDGVFKPLEPVSLNEHQQVTLEILDLPASTGSSDALERLPVNGAELVEYWKQKGVFASRPDITDSLEYARKLRREAETRSTD
jgi:predicted DNA-binding antitoxin AbrB/MazE fold protein